MIATRIRGNHACLMWVVLPVIILTGMIGPMKLEGRTLPGNLKYVNLFMGTSGDNGQVTPGAAVPFGMLCLCPDSEPRQHAGYDYAEPVTTGVSINRLSGIGCSGVGGNLRIKPATKDEVLKIVKETEKAIPGYYTTEFSNGAKGEFTVSRTVALEKWTLPEDGVMFINFKSAFERRKTSCEYEIVSDREITGRIESGTACARGKYSFYFRLRTDKPFTVEESSEDEATVKFAEREVEIRIAVSPIDQLSADKELELAAGKTFAKVCKEALDQWKQKLSKVSVKGGSEEQKYLFYTSLYRLYMSPMDVTSCDGKYLGTDGVVYDTEGRRAFNSWSMWDTYRAKFPMLLLLEPEAYADMAASCVNLFRTGKKNWATDCESAPTVRTEHMGIMLLDAYRKGIPVDFRPGYDGMVREVLMELPRESPDNLLELCNDLWALGQIAEIIGSNEDAAKFTAEADSTFEKVWKEIFMTVTDDFSLMKNNGLYQGTKWQYRWSCPQYSDRMIAWHGAEQLAEELDTFFKEGMFNQGNEPDIQTPFMFNQFGRPDKTQEWVRRYLTDDNMKHLYGGQAEYPEPFVGRAFQNKTDGYAPEMDEDDGTMSGWYMFSQLGFYPLNVGIAKYELFSPIFKKVVFKSGDHKVRIKAVGRKSYEDPIKEITVDGKKLDSFELDHGTFRKNSTVVYKY